MAVDPSPDLELRPLRGRPRTIRQQLTTFHLLFVALDPYEEPSSWILPTAVRVLSAFEQADVRVAFLVTADAPDAKIWLGPHAAEFMTFLDPDRSVVKAFGLEGLPALVHVAMDGTVEGAAEGWRPSQWHAVTEHLAKVMGWKGPVLPGPKDPGPFKPTAAV